MECRVPEYFILSGSTTLKHVTQAVVGQYEYVHRVFVDRPHYRQKGGSFYLYTGYDKKNWYMAVVWWVVLKT